MYLITLKVDMVFAYFQAQKTFGQEMDKASKYLLKELKNAKDPYFVSIVTYAFHLSEHSEKDVALQKLLSLSTRGGKLYLNDLFSNENFLTSYFHWQCLFENYIEIFSV